VSDVSNLADLLRPVKHVLVDFDGPLCSVFAGLSAMEVAARLIADSSISEAAARGGWEGKSDPLALLRRISDERPDLVSKVDRALAHLEREAVLLATPTSGSEEFLRGCRDSGRSVFIVSNNSGDAIQVYLDRRDLGGYVDGVFGRVPDQPSSMKPSPRLLSDAMDAAAAKPAECIFIGDAVRDVQAGEAAGIITIGYANKPGKEDALRRAGAAVVVDSMQAIRDALV
jgi:N-acetyl-D-muramate 6-phosphate phosphatase